MSLFELILIVLIAAAAFAAGYKIGQASAPSGAGRAGTSPPPPVDTDDGELLPGPHSLPTRSRAAPPPASAGGGSDGDTAADRPAARNMPPRRSTTPPPASAGLMDKGGAEHSPKKSG
jgi:hypothetical protein